MKINISFNKTFDILDFFDTDDLSEEYTVEQFKEFLIDNFNDYPEEFIDYLVIQQVED